ncbi:TPA: hypothetical protein PMC35_003505 [Vibrio cholerae]|nr:hypothetical protein [Vibrio cholerae]
MPHNDERHNCYDDFLKTVDVTEHAEQIQNKEEFSFVCPRCGKEASYENNFDGTMSPKYDQ